MAVTIDAKSLAKAQYAIDKDLELFIDDPWAIINPKPSVTEVRTVSLPPPHSPGQREMIEWPGSGVVFAGRRYGKCLPGWQLIYMADGTKKMAEDMVVGDVVLSLNTETRQMEEKPVTAVMKNGVKDIYEVSTDRHTLLCTPNHPFLGDGGWIEARNLTLDTQVFAVNETDWYTPVLFNIKKIVSLWETETWDITVQDNHNFVAEGFIVHNTEAAVQRILRMTSQQPGLYWWVGLSWKSASMKRAWRIIMDLSSQAIRASGYSPAKQINRSNFEIRLPNGSEIWMRTAERPESLAGEGIRGAIVDEFTLMPETIWTEYLEGTLLDHGGSVLFVGVPKGRNWGALLYEKAKSRKGWKAWHFTTYDNPFIEKAKIDEVRDNVSEALFRQEYMAMVVDDAGSVFRGIMAAATAHWQDEPHEGHIYCMGIDWARTNDFTVLIVIDTTLGEVCHMSRFNQIDYELQALRFKALWNTFRPSITVGERNNMGDPIIEALQGQGYPIKAFRTTMQSKDAIIKGLSLAIEQQKLRILADDVMIGELQSYEMVQTGSGAWKYSHPSGGHDDIVMSLALAWSGVNAYTPPVLVVPQSVTGRSKWRNGNNG